MKLGRIINLNVGNLEPCTIALTGDGGGAISHNWDIKNVLDEGDNVFNGAVDGIVSMILSHAIAGVDVESEAYRSGVFSALEQCGNNI
jgi:hypothetical protein